VRTYRLDKMQQQGSRNRSKAHPIIRELPLDQLKRVLSEHRAWLDSDGKSGEKAGLSRAQLQGLSLWSADLREADLSYANLQARLWITLACAAPTCGMQRWKVPRCGGLICGMQISATPPPASKAGPRRSFGCQSAQRPSHRSLTLGSAVVESSVRECNRDYRRTVEERASRPNVDGPPCRG
jgi:hypothetical protein